MNHLKIVRENAVDRELDVATRECVDTEESDRQLGRLVERRK